MIVAVDGPSGAGKSTVCREVAQRLGFQLVDTGAIYRSVALLALEDRVPLEDARRLGALAGQLDIHFLPGETGQRVLLGERDVTDAIRTTEVSRAVSPVSAHAAVRDALLETQRALGRRRDSIVEGRDIGTVVFPDAELKIFYTASVDARAERRHQELQRRGESLSLAQVEREIEERDERDRSRAVAPLRQPADAVLLDTSELDFEAACSALIAEIDAARPAAAEK